MTADGSFVHECEIPPFNVPPDVLFWGQRTFQRDRSVTWDNYYTEAFCYFIVDFSPASK